MPTNTPKCFVATTSGGKPSRNDQRFTLARSKSLSAGGETSRCQNISFGYIRYISTSEKNNKLSIMTTGSCPPDETSLGVGQVQSYLQITTAWLGLTIPTPSGKQCQGRGSQDDDDYTSNIFILEAPLNRKTTWGMSWTLLKLGYNKHPDTPILATKCWNAVSSCDWIT